MKWYRAAGHAVGQAWARLLFGHTCGLQACTCTLQLAGLQHWFHPVKGAVQPGDCTVHRSERHGRLAGRPDHANLARFYVNSLPD